MEYQAGSRKGKKAKEKRLHHTPYKAHYDRMLVRLATRVGHRMRRLRALTVEPVLGSLITYFGLRLMSKKRQAGAANVMYLAAMAYNLKKYLHATPHHQAHQVVALPLPNQFRWLLLYFCNSHCNHYPLNCSSSLD